MKVWFWKHGLCFQNHTFMVLESRSMILEWCSENYKSMLLDPKTMVWWWLWYMKSKNTECFIQPVLYGSREPTMSEPWRFFVQIQFWAKSCMLLGILLGKVCCSSRKKCSDNSSSKTYTRMILKNKLWEGPVSKVFLHVAVAVQIIIVRPPPSWERYQNNHLQL